MDEGKIPSQVTYWQLQLANCAPVSWGSPYNVEMTYLIVGNQVKTQQNQGIAYLSYIKMFSILSSTTHHNKYVQHCMK